MSKSRCSSSLSHFRTNGLASICSSNRSEELLISRCQRPSVIPAPFCHMLSSFLVVSLSLARAMIKNNTKFGRERRDQRLVVMSVFAFLTENKQGGVTVVFMFSQALSSCFMSSFMIWRKYIRLCLFRRVFLCCWSFAILD